MTAVLLLALAAPPSSYATQWGVVSADGKAVYLRHDKGFDALDGATGKPLWTAEGDSRPVWAGGAVVLAYGPGKGGLRLLALDAATGKAKWDKTSPLPEWAAVANGPGRAFTARAAEADGSLFLGYQANTWYYGGAAPPPEVERAARKEDGATLKIDAASGKSEKLAAAKFPAAGPSRNGDVTFTVEPAERVVLKRSKAGKALPAVTLSDKPARVSISLDGKLVLIQGDGDGKRAPGKAFDTATGEAAGRFETTAGLQSLDAAGGKVFAFGAAPGREMPFGTFARTLEVIDLKTGKAVWSRKGESLTVTPPPP